MKKNFFKILSLSFSTKFDWGSYSIPIAQDYFQKSVGLICSVKFLFSEVGHYLDKSNIQPCMIYC